MNNCRKWGLTSMIPSGSMPSGPLSLKMTKHIIGVIPWKLIPHNVSTKCQTAKILRSLYAPAEGCSFSSHSVSPLFTQNMIVPIFFSVACIIKCLSGNVLTLNHDEVGYWMEKISSSFYPCACKQTPFRKSAISTSSIQDGRFSSVRAETIKWVCENSLHN